MLRSLIRRRKIHECEYFYSRFINYRCRNLFLFDNFAMKFLSFYINYFRSIFVFAKLKCIFTTEVCISSSFNQKNV